VQISTSEYKISPLKKAARELLGYPHPRRVPRGVYVEQAIGISTDEFTRAKDSGVRYLRNVFPLIDLGWDRTRCADYLAERGFGETVKSACVGCPFHGNAGWRWLRDNDPDGWAEAVGFDKAIRDGYPHATTQGQQLRGQYFLHRSCQPLDEVDLARPLPESATCGWSPPSRWRTTIPTVARRGRVGPAPRSPWSVRHDNAAALAGRMQAKASHSGDGDVGRLPQLRAAAGRQERGHRHRWLSIGLTALPGSASAGTARAQCRAACEVALHPHRTTLGANRWGAGSPRCHAASCRRRTLAAVVR
jgi:hypothetical protein